MGVYDLPAMITYITNITLQPLHTYIGHSMGTTASYVMATERPEIARMVRAIISLAPVAFLEHIKSPIRFFAPFVNEYEVICLNCTVRKLLYSDLKRVIVKELHPY